MALEKTRIDKLIESASKKAGTEYKLAKEMGYSQQQINDWKKQTEAMPDRSTSDNGRHCRT